MPYLEARLIGVLTGGLQEDLRERASGYEEHWRDDAPKALEDERKSALWAIEPRLTRAVRWLSAGRG